MVENVLVLGGNGYLGSKVVHQLVTHGINVVCTKRRMSNLSRIEDILSKIKVIPASIEAIEVMLLHMKFDWVLNMACNYGRSDDLYDNSIEANIVYPLQVLNLVSEHGVKAFLTIGTGLPDELNMYSFSKAIFSKFGQFYVQKHNINFIDLKLEMFYGYDEPQDRFLSDCVNKCILGMDVNVTYGTQKRDIISVDDVIRAIECVMHADLKGYNIIPLGSGYAPTIHDIVDYIWNETGCLSKISYGAVPMRNCEPNCVANIDVLKKLGFGEPIFWKDGIHKMIEDMKKTKIKE